MKTSSIDDSIDLSTLPILKIKLVPQETNGVINGYRLRFERVSDEENPFLTTMQK
jgi:hypothetical protein